MGQILQIINFRTFVVTLCAVISTFLCIEFNITADFPLTLIATAVIFPIVFSINGAYKRRETALANYASIKSHGRAIFFAARAWLENPSEDTLKQARNMLGNLLDSCKTLFSNPTGDLRKNENHVYQCFSDLSKFIKHDLRDNGLGADDITFNTQEFLERLHD